MRNTLLFLSEGYDIISVTYDINSVNGICMEQNKKYFYKILNKQSAQDEVIGYELARSFVPCTSLCRKIDTENYDVLIYSYEEVIRYNKGLLFDYLCDESIEFEEFVDKYTQILKLYSSTFSKISENSDSKSLNQFVTERIESRLKGWYWNSDLKMNNDGIICSMAEVSKKLYKYMKAYKPSEYHLTHGDPSDMNIAITPKFLDYTTFGYNSMLLEFASFYWNLTFGGLYFFPKYHKHKYILHQYPLPEISVAWSENNLEYYNARYKCMISKKRIAAVELLISTFKQYLQVEAKDIIYFIVFRIMTILNIHYLEKKDQVFILILIHKLFSYLDSKEDIFQNLIKFVADSEEHIRYIEEVHGKEFDGKGKCAKLLN